MNWNPFKKKSRWGKLVSDPHRYDCTKETWGHTCNIDSKSKFDITDGPKNERGTYYKCDGHLHPSVRVGDQVIISFEKGDVILTFVEVTNCRDPRDMYFATIGVLGYIKDVPELEIKDEIRPLTQLQQDPEARKKYYSDPEFKKQADKLRYS